MKTKISRTLSCVLGFLAVLCFTLAFSFNTKESPASATELVDSGIQDEYYVGTEFTMPATVTISVGNNETVTGSNGVLVFPDGTVHDSASYYFELEGEYQAIFYGTYQGRTVKASKTFKVLKLNWSVSSSKSDMVYMDTMPLNQQSGIRVSLAEGDAFVFDQRVNINDLIATQGDTISVISYTPELWREGEDMLACQTVSIKLIDYYNPDNFVEFYQWGGAGAIPYKLNGSTNTSTLYAGAGASHQDLTGLEYYSGMTEDKITDKFDGYQGRIHRSDRYETVQAYGAVYSRASAYVYSPSNYTGTPVTSARTQVNFKFNPETGHAFAGTTFLTGVKSQYVHPGNTWQGFTTGEVYVQVQFFNYKYGTPINIEITEILGMKGAALNKAYVKDVVDPVVEFDTEYTDANGVYVEKDVPFTIPTPTVYDINYEGDLDVAVYYNYSSDTPISVYLKDNVFTPTSYGRYTAVYTATDKFGNKTVATYNMNAVDGKQFVYDKENKLSELSAATENVIPTLDVTGMNKAVDTKVYVIDPAGKANDVTATMKHAPEYLGNYTVRYVFTDNATTSTYEYTVESKEKGYVLFRDGFKTSEYLIKDATYDFDDYYAYKATANGLVPVLATVQASIDNAEFANIANLNAYKIQGEENLKIKAVYGENSLVIADCKIVDVGFADTNKDYTKYFQGADSAETTISEIKYNFLASNQEKKLDFINPLMLGTFQLDVVVPTGATYNEYNITLSEFGNPANKMVVKYTTIVRGIETLLVIKFIDADGSLLYEKELAGKFDAKHSIFIKDGVFNTTEGVSFDAPKFTDHRVMVSVDVVSDEDCSISFTKIGNQNLSSRIKRNNEAKPQLYYVRVPGDYTLGATVDVPRAYAVSIFSPVLESDVTVSVTNVEGTEYISNANGQLKDLIANQPYQFELSYLGSFKITYKFSASAGKGETRSDDESFVITCSDSVAPEITFEEGISEKTLIITSTGKTHKIKSFTVSDNETAADALFVQVLIFNEYYTTIAYNVMNPDTFNGEYTFEEPGNYIVFVYCEDGVGNYSTTYYNICVED